MYGGSGTPKLWVDGHWSLPGESTIVLQAGSLRERGRSTVRRRTA
jgi:hypothetical protein